MAGAGAPAGVGRLPRAADGRPSGFWGLAVASSGQRRGSHNDLDAGDLRGAGRRPRTYARGSGRRLPDILAPGRVLLGLGAGHTPQEWQDIGQHQPAPHDRAARLAEFVSAIAGLIKGDTVTREGSHITLRGSRLDGLPADDRIRLAVGGGHPEILARRSPPRHVVALSGLGRTLPDGHHHQVRWSAADLQHQLQLVGEEAHRAGNTPVIEALVQNVTVTSDRAAGIQQISDRIPGASADDIDRTPFLLIGSHEQIAAQMLAQAEELGITSYVVREPAIPHIEPVLALLTR